MGVLLVTEEDRVESLVILSLLVPILIIWWRAPHTYQRVWSGVESPALGVLP